MLSRCIVGRSGGRTPRPPKIFNKRTQWSNPGPRATWHLFIRPHYATCPNIICPAANELQTAMSALPLSCHVTRPRGMLTSACATCHPSSGDTCHLQIGQTTCQKVQKCMTRVTPRNCHMSYMNMPCVLYGPATCRVRTGTASIIFFPCLAQRTDLDNFSIRTPFAK
jgi:hypothetical protein